jgi:chromosome segregation protein
MQAIRLLDENKKGKANFFLLDRINKTGAVYFHSLEGTIPAMSVVEVDEKYRKLAEHLLNNVFIAENDEVLNTEEGHVIIEKSGKYVKGKYSLSGGSVGMIEGKKIGRARNLEKLQEEIVAQESAVEILRSEIQERQNEVTAFNEELRESAIDNIEFEIQQLTNQVFALHNKLENLHSMQTGSQQRHEELNVQMQQTYSSVEGVRKQLQEYNVELQVVATKLNEATDAFKTAETSYNDALHHFNDFNLTVTKQHSKINALRQELEFKNNQLQDLKLQIDENSNLHSETAGAIAQSLQALNDLSESLKHLLVTKEEEEQKLNEADQHYYNLRNRLAEKESELRHRTKEKEQTEQLLGEIKDQLNDVKLQLAGMKERLNVEFKVNLEEIIDEPRITDMPIEELQEKVDRMKKRLENLGEVNPTAIEAFTEMKKRYEFIVEQKNDLVTAKESLLKTIEEVEATANQKFLETFNRVRDNFQNVFKTLFTEDDQCDLILENPENLADTGIDVIAKPRGKRPTSLTQLSGGERTLTATALLFAIYLIKPAPFCILDEVDAPLDDGNVGKFTNMIRQFSENSQFIIVTHNKMTMSTVDVIYGVTMQEPGVSKLVPVDFRGLNEN